MNKTKVFHEFGPVYDSSSRVLLLGSIPSPLSRKISFYYGNPRNRFWSVLSKVLDVTFPEDKEEKIALLNQYHIALWDVLESCIIKGASDSSIEDPVPNDISMLVGSSDIRGIFTTGKRAYELYNELCLPSTHMEAICLPSTSPANCRMSEDELVKSYSQILNYI